MRYIYLSPHFDDAIYSCGGTIYGQVRAGDEALVITVFGAGASDMPLSPLAQRLHAQWGVGVDAVSHRAAEDRRAAQVVGAKIEQWDFLDALYRGNDSGFNYSAYEQLFGERHPLDNSLVEQIGARLLDFAHRNSDAVYLAPLGVGSHVDHFIVREAAEKLLEHNIQLQFYEDQPYTGFSPEQLAKTLFPRADGWWEPVEVPISMKRKVEAISCYASQGTNITHNRRGIDSYARLLAGRRGAAERTWRLCERQALTQKQIDDLVVCPLCRGRFLLAEKLWTCISCGKEYPVYYGIPDLRVFDPSQAGYVPLEKDLERAGQVAVDSEELTFTNMVTQHIERSSPSTRLAAHYLHYRISVRERVADLLNRWLFFPANLRPSWSVGPGLDIGCGSGVGLLALSAVSPAVAGVDLSVAELLVARKLLDEQGVGKSVLLISACAEALPFKDGTFATVVARDVYEHVPNRNLFMKEAYRALRRGGIMLFNTTSRFSWLEPHVLLKGLGYMPRAVQPHIVRLLRHRNYEIFLPAKWELKQEVQSILPAGTPFAVRTPRRVKPEQIPNTRKGRLIRRLPGLVRLVNLVHSHTQWFEVVVGKNN